MGCASGKIIPEPTSIRVPSGLSVTDTKKALAAALAAVKVDHDTWSLNQTWTSVTLTRGKQNNWWYPEDYGDEIIYAGYSWGSHYLQVAIHYDSQFVRIEITDSKNLKQNKKRIHGKALQLIGQLEDRIRISLGEMDAARSGL